MFRTLQIHVVVLGAALIALYGLLTETLPLIEVLGALLVCVTTAVGALLIED